MHPRDVDNHAITGENEAPLSPLAYLRDVKEVLCTSACAIKETPCNTSDRHTGAGIGMCVESTELVEVEDSKTPRSLEWPVYRTAVISMFPDRSRDTSVWFCVSIFATRGAASLPMDLPARFKCTRKVFRATASMRIVHARRDIFENTVMLPTRCRNEMDLLTATARRMPLKPRSRALDASSKLTQQAGETAHWRSLSATQRTSA